MLLSFPVMWWYFSQLASFPTHLCSLCHLPHCFMWQTMEGGCRSSKSGCAELPITSPPSQSSLSHPLWDGRGQRSSLSFYGGPTSADVYFISSDAERWTSRTRNAHKQWLNWVLWGGCLVRSGWRSAAWERLEKYLKVEILQTQWRSWKEFQ